VALWGYSLGAWYAALVACRDVRLASVVLAAPGVRLNPWVSQKAVRPRIRRKLARARKLCDALNSTAMNLTMTHPVIPAKNILLLEASHDSMMSPKEDAEDLWHSWGKTDIWRLPHGHVGVCCGFVPGLTGRILRWLSPRLNVPTAQVRPTEPAR
jgi:pimeloyl-ACP methyl ester carboxylesterase